MKLEHLCRLWLDRLKSSDACGNGWHKVLHEPMIRHSNHSHSPVPLIYTLLATAGAWGKGG